MIAVRRTFAALSLVLVFVATPARAASPAWDHAGYDAEDSYYNPGESAINAGTITSLAERWSVPLRRFDMTCGGSSSPLVTAGWVVVSDERGISAYQAADGRARWHFDWTDPGDASVPNLAVSGNTLVAGGGDCNSNSDPDGSLVALDLTTGKVRWRLDTDNPILSFTVDKGMVVVSGSSPSDEAATSAYRVADGKLAWKKPLYDASSVSADGWLLLTRARSVTAVSVTTGATRWTKPGTWTAEAATPAADLFLVSNGTALSAIKAATGALVWTAAGKQSTLLATDGRRVYRASGRTVEALDLRNGRRLWSRVLPVESRQPVRAGGLVYTGTQVLNAASGTVVTPGTAFAGYQVATGGRLYTVNGYTMSTYAP